MVDTKEAKFGPRGKMFNVCSVLWPNKIDGLYEVIRYMSNFSDFQ